MRISANVDSERKARPHRPLGVRDHTLIVEAVMGNALATLHHLPPEIKSSGTEIRDAPIAVLQAALKVPAIKKSVKERIILAIDLLEKVEGFEKNIPKAALDAFADLKKRLRGKTPLEQIKIFQSKKTRKQYYNIPGVIEGMDVATAILKDGRDSIYSLSFPFYEVISGGSSTAVARDALSDIGSMDSIGSGIAGAAAAAGWAVAGAAGAVGAGALGGAFGAGLSIGAALGALIDWIRS